MLNGVIEQLGLGLSEVLSIPDKEFVGYQEEVQESMHEILNGSAFKDEIKKAILSQHHNSYLLEQDLKQSIDEIKSDLHLFSPEKQQFILDIYLSVVNTALEVVASDMFVKLPVHIKKIRDNAILPTYAHDTDAAADIYAAESMVINPGEKVAVPTGWAVAVPYGYQLNVYLRSGIAAKTPLILANGVGICDAGYRNEMFVILGNIGSEPYTVNRGDRIAQCQVAPVIQMDWIESEDLLQFGNDRGGGLGSTGQ